MRAAADHYGQVTFGGLPVPGATVTATQGDKQFVAITDTQGIFRIADLADGVCTIRIEMLGFSAISQELDRRARRAAVDLGARSCVPFDEIAALAGPATMTAIRLKPDPTTGDDTGFSAPRRAPRPR